MNTSPSSSAPTKKKVFHREVLFMQIRDPDVAAWTSAREERIRRNLRKFLLSKSTSYRVRDLEAAAELICDVIEEVSPRAVLFDSPVGEM